MSAGLYNFTIEQGTTIRRRFVWTDSDNQPVNLTGADVRMQVRKSKSTTAGLLADWTEFLTLTGEDGQVDLLVPGDASINYIFDTGYYSLRVDRPGDDKRLIEGFVSNSRETTA